jgi:O-antigen/teichoic acid export membrane protein
MSILKKFAGQTALYGLSSIIGRLLNYFLVPIYTRVFVGLEGKAEYGISAEFFAYASFGSVLFTYGMETAFFRFMQKEDNKERVFSTVLISIIGTAIVLGGLMILFATPIANMTNNSGREAYIYCLVSILAADAISSILFAKLRQQNEAIRFVTIRLLSIGVNIALNLIFYLLIPYLVRHGLFAPLSSHEPLAIWMFVANVVSSLIVFPFMMRELKDIKKGFDSQLWSKMLQYGFPVLFIGLAGMVNETLDRILIKQLSPTNGEVINGIYSANYKLSIIITLFIQAFRMGAEPFFFARAQEGDAPRTYAQIMQYFMLVCATIFIGVLLYLDIFKYFIGSQYWEGLHVVPILLMANVFLGAYYNLSIWYKLTDRTALGARVSFIGAAITLILNYLWIPIYSYTGSAWATLICYFSMAAISYFLGQKYYPVPYPMRKILAYLALALTVYLVSEMLKDTFSYGPSVSLLVNTVLMCIYGFIIFKMEEKDFKNLYRSIRKRS